MVSKGFVVGGSFSTGRRLSLIVAEIGAGVPGGPISAKKPSARGIAGSVSAMVGVSGRFGRRCAEPPPRSLSVPPLIQPARLGTPSLIPCPRPPLTPPHPAPAPGAV